MVYRSTGRIYEQRSDVAFVISRVDALLHTRFVNAQGCLTIVAGGF
jgi:hypothetical protein